MTEPREIKESPLRMGADETITFQLTTTPWGSSPSSIVVKLYDITQGGSSDVSATKLTGSASAGGDVITLPVISGLVSGNRYRLDIKFTTGGNILECYAEIECD